MSPELDTQQEEAEVAFSIEQRVKAAIALGRQALWALAEALYEFDEANGWRSLGHENLSQWLADADVTITRGTYYRLVRTWRKLVVHKQIDPERVRQLDQAKVAIVTDKIVSNEVLVEDALADVESLGAQDLREKYYGPRPTDEPPAEQPVDRWEQSDGVEDDGTPGSPTERELDGLEAGELPPVEGVVVVDAAVIDALDLPGWVTEGNVEAALGEFQEAVDSGGSFPRVGRRHVQVAVELAKAWLATRPS